MITIDDKILDELVDNAADSHRKRVHYNLHSDLNDKIHRLCVAIEPGSYIRPHRHFNPHKWELMIILRGKMAVLLFDDIGKVINRVELTPGKGNSSVEIPHNIWHTFISMESGSVIFEIKSGPYFKPIESDFASWAPKEGVILAKKIEKWLQTAEIGDAVDIVS